MPSASRSASVAAFLRRHILSVMGNPSRSARNAPNMRISIWSMVSTASTSPAWNRRSPSPSKSSRSEYRDSSRTGSFLRILPAGSPRQCMARADTMALESPHDSWTSRPQGRCLGPHRLNAAQPSRLLRHQPASGLYRVAPLPRAPKPSRCYADMPRAPAAMRYRACTQSTPRQV